MTILRQSDLGPDSLLYFVHIPKTAGTSVRKFLDQHFLTRTVFPAEVGESKYSGLSDVQLVSDLRERPPRKWRLIRGHFDYDTIDRLALLAGTMERVTILRDPVTQLFSEYQMALHDPAYPLHNKVKREAPSFEQFLDGEDYPWIKNGNRQSGHLMIQSTGEELWPSPDRWRKALQSELLDYACVGVFESLRETLELVAYIFGWEYPDRIPHLNKSRGSGTQGLVKESTRNAICERNCCDCSLYEWACERFAVAYGEMLADLGLSENRIECDRALLRERLNERAKHRRAQRLKMFAATDYYEVISIDGTLLRFLDRARGCQVEWIGPEPAARVRLAFAEPCDRVLRIELQYWLTDEMLAQCAVTVNGHRIPLAKWRDETRVVFLGHVPEAALAAAPHDSLIEMTTCGVDTPARLGLNPRDTETKCVAVSDFQMLRV